MDEINKLEELLIKHFQIINEAVAKASTGDVNTGNVVAKPQQLQLQRQQPAQSAKQAQPVQLAKPAQPVQSAKPAQPAQPAQSAKPAQPAKSFTDKIVEEVKHVAHVTHDAVQSALRKAQSLGSPRSSSPNASPDASPDASSTSPFVTNTDKAKT